MHCRSIPRFWIFVVATLVPRKRYKLVKKYSVYKVCYDGFPFSLSELIYFILLIKYLVSLIKKNWCWNSLLLDVEIVALLLNWRKFFLTDQTIEIPGRFLLQIFPGRAWIFLVLSLLSQIYQSLARFFGV